MLFDPLMLRNIVFRNRVVVSPMCQYASEDGFAGDWHMVHYGGRAVGGAGLILTEAIAVSAAGRISSYDLGIWKDEHVAKLEPIFRFIESQGSVAGVQLAHAGRKASARRPWEGGRPLGLDEGGWKIAGPSPIPFDAGYQVPGVLTFDDIQAVVRSFAQAARRALQAGCKVVEIHAAHGYLLHQFLSPTSNKRTDAYGGSLKNRSRFLMETVAAVRGVWPEKYPLFVRLSVTDWTEPEGWDLEQSLALALELKAQGVDLIDCSSGDLLPQAKIPAGPGFQVPFSARIRKEAGIATGAVGLVLSPSQAEMIVRTGQADMIFLGREFLRDPYWPLHAGSQPWPQQYARAEGRREK